MMQPVWGMFEDAYRTIHTLNDAVASSGQKPVELFVNFKYQYKTMYEAGGFQIERPQKTVKIPITWLSGNRKNPTAVNVHFN